MNYYNILGIDENASQQEIKKAYRDMMHAFHPDHYRGPDPQFAEQKTKDLIKAYETLSNPEKKKRYDAHIRAGGDIIMRIPILKKKGKKIKLRIKIRKKTEIAVNAKHRRANHQVA